MFGYYGVQIAMYTTDFFAFLFNSLLLYLIYTETTKELREYKNVLILNCIIDFSCVFLNLFNGAHFEIMQGLWIHVLSGPAAWFPRSFHYMFCGSYSFTLSWGIISLPVPFYFRWSLLCRNRRVETAELFRLGALTFSLALVFLISFGYSFYVSADWNERELSFLHSNRFLFAHPNATPVLVIGELNTYPMMFVILLSITIEPVICGLIAYFSYGVYLELNKMRDQFREKTRRLQKQMNFMLAAQVFLFFALALIPLFVLLFLMILKCNVVGVGTLITLLLTCIPLLSPLSTLCLVSRFRQRAIRMITSPFASFFSTSTTPVISLDTNTSSAEHNKRSNLFI